MILENVLIAAQHVSDCLSPALFVRARELPELTAPRLASLVPRRHLGKEILSSGFTHHFSSYLLDARIKQIEKKNKHKNRIAHLLPRQNVHCRVVVKVEGAVSVLLQNFLY